MGKALVQKLQTVGSPYLALNKATCDLANHHSLTRIVKDPPTTIIHLAAVTSLGNPQGDNQVAAEETRRIDDNVAQMAREWGSRVIYASTCLLYDRRDSAEKNEESPVRARADSPYSSAKLEGEKIFLSIPESLVFRLSAPVGRSMSRNLVLTKFVLSALRDEPLRVWGNGSREQDFIDVDDVAEFLLSAVSAKRLPSLLNLVSSNHISMSRLAHLVVSTIGGGRVQILGETSPDPLEGEYARYSNKLAHESLGWTSSTDLRVSILRMREFFEQKHN